MISREILILPRLFLGVIFSIASYSKISSGDFPAHLSGFLSQVPTNATFAYQAFAQAIVLPHVATVATLVIIGETFVGIAMLAGITTRLASVVAVLLLLNYMFAKGMTLWTPASNDAADIILAIVVGVGAAGRVWGVDAVLKKRYPRVPLW
jgi:thiosulfate dehydrogenase [quinone] large subunit